MSTGTVAVDHDAVRDVLVRFAGTLVKHYLLDDVLDQLGSDVRRILDVAGVGIMLEDDEGRLRFMSTSDARLRHLEALQIELDEGPCLLAYRTVEPVMADDLSVDERFRRFGPRAVDAGMAAVFSFPMVVDAEVVGAANLYRSTAGHLLPEQVEVGQTLAHVATCYMMHARDLEQRDLVTSQLQQALTTRAVIEQAKGFVAHALGCGATEAFDLIRRYARNRQIRVRQVAGDMMDGRLSVRDLALG